MGGRNFDYKVKVATLSVLRFLSWSFALLATPMAMPTAALAQQTEVEDTGTIDDFRLDQPAGPGNPVRTPPPETQPAPQPAPRPTAPTETPAVPQAEPARRPAARPATETRAPATASSSTPSAAASSAPAAARPQTAAPVTPNTTAPSGTTNAIAPPALGGEATLPAVSETIPDDVVADDAQAGQSADRAPDTDAEPAAEWVAYWPYALGGLVTLVLAAWFLRRRSTTPYQGVAEAESVAEPAPAPTPTPTPTIAPAPATALDLTEPLPAPERKGPPPGTIGVSAAKLFGTPQPAPQPNPRPTPSAARPSAASQGFVTTRAPLAEATRPTVPSGTVGIPASRIAQFDPRPEPPPPAIELVEGTRLAAQFAAPELIRDTDGLRLRFALGVGNIGNMVAKDVRIRTVLLTAAPDSDRAIAEWMANPKGQPAATIDHIDGGTQTNITGDIQLNADQIRAMSMQGQAIFVPMFAISIEFLGAEGLDRFGEAYVIGLPPERASSNGAFKNGRARVLPLPHDENLPRRWTDLVHSRANIGG